MELTLLALVVLAIPYAGVVGQLAAVVVFIHIAARVYRAAMRVLRKSTDLDEKEV